MPRFPLLTISALFHLLVGWRVTPALLDYSQVGGVAFCAWLAISAMLMPMGLVKPKFASARLGSQITWAGLIAMGFFSSVLVGMVLRELALGVLSGLSWLGAIQFALEPLRIGSAVAVVPLALVMTVVGFWNARRTAAVVRVDVPIKNLPTALEGFSIAQISDIHVGPTIKTRYLRRIVDRVNLLQADMVAITGDLVDGPVHTLGVHIDSLRGLRSSHGTYFVTGNHEYYSGAHQWIDKLRTLGITVLMNEHVVIEHGTDPQSGDSATVVISGVADYHAHHFDESHRSDPHAALTDAPSNAHFKLLLAHQPRSASAAAAAGFDLQLSGHTHGGQFWPWGHFVRFQQPFTAGLHKLRNLWVYTSRGTGYWGPPKRFGAPSEITHLRLVMAK